MNALHWYTPRPSEGDQTRAAEQKVRKLNASTKHNYRIVGVCLFCAVKMEKCRNFSKAYKQITLSFWRVFSCALYSLSFLNDRSWSSVWMEETSVLWLAHPVISAVIFLICDRISANSLILSSFFALISSNIGVTDANCSFNDVPFFSICIQRFKSWSTSLPKMLSNLDTITKRYCSIKRLFATNWCVRNSRKQWNITLQITHLNIQRTWWLNGNQLTKTSKRLPSIPESIRRDLQGRP